MYLATWGDHFILEKIELDAFFFFAQDCDPCNL